MKSKLNFHQSLYLLTLLILIGPASLSLVVEGSNLKTTAVTSETFVSQWDTTLNSIGSSTNLQIRLPLESSGTYDFTVDWGDGTNSAITSWDQAEVTHTYVSGGIYTLAIDGTLVGWQFDNGGDKLKIIQISQWGNIRLGNSGGYFYGSSNLQLTATDALNLTGTTTLERAFTFCGNLGNSGDMNNWNVSSVTNMEAMFSSTSSFNRLIGNWNVSSVTNMETMFSGASSFNQPIGNWNVSSVTNMSAMFFGASSFNQPIDSWDVSSVTYTGRMFYNAFSFNQSLDNWDVSRVTGMDEMFRSASSFNQPIGNWNVSSVTNMEAMFRSASSFNQPIGNWNVSSGPDMRMIFYGASSFNQPIDSWDVSSVTYTGRMFYNALSFNQSLENWDVSRVTDMDEMFRSASSFNQPIGNWNVSSVTNMQVMFRSASSFNQPIGNWNVSSGPDMRMIFYGASSFNQPIANWDVSNMTSMGAMFSGASSFNQPIGNWNVSSVTGMGSMFRGASSFNQSIANWDVSSVTSMRYMFNGASSFNQPLGNWDVSRVVSMTSMFQDAILFNQSIVNWDVSSVTEMNFMFVDALSFDQSLGNWDVSSVRYMQDMFLGVTLSVANYDDLLTGWATLSLQHTVRFHGGNSFYTNFNARQHIIDTFGWIIDDGGSVVSTPPQNVNAILVGSTIELSWSAPISDRGYSITEYNIYRTTTPGVNYVFLASSASFSYVDTAIVEGDKYYYILKAVNIYGEGEASIEVNPDYHPPQIIPIGDISVQYGSSGVNLDWLMGDLNPDIYNVTKDGSLYIADTPWSSGHTIVNIDGLEIGSYEFTIYVYDIYGQMSSDTVTVTVVAPVGNSDTDTTDSGNTDNTDTKDTNTSPESDSNFLQFPLLLISIISATIIQRFRKYKNNN